MCQGFAIRRDQRTAELTMWADYDNGCRPIGVGKMLGYHLILTGEELWFCGNPTAPAVI